MPCHGVISEGARQAASMTTDQAKPSQAKPSQAKPRKRTEGVGDGLVRGHGGDQVADRGGAVGDEDDHHEVEVEAVGVGLQVGHAVHDGREDGGVDDGVGQLRQRARQEVGRDAAHVVGSGQWAVHREGPSVGQSVKVDAQTDRQTDGRAGALSPPSFLPSSLPSFLPDLYSPVGAREVLPHEDLHLRGERLEEGRRMGARESINQTRYQLSACIGRWQPVIQSMP